MERRPFVLAMPVCLALLLAGCGAKGPVVQSAGSLPRGADYGFAEDAAPLPSIAPALTAELARQDLRLSDHPRYLVQAEYSRPPARTGALVADQPAPAWQRAPLRRRGAVSHFSLSMTEVATGAEVYRTTAWQPARPGVEDSAALVQAAFNPPAKMPSTPPPPPPPPPPAQ
jgi:hypothetical protein